MFEYAHVMGYSVWVCALKSTKNLLFVGLCMYQGSLGSVHSPILPSLRKGHYFTNALAKDPFAHTMSCSWKGQFLVRLLINVYQNLVSFSLLPTQVANTFLVY